MIYLFITILLSVSQAEELWLRVGEVRTLPAPSEATVRVGTRGIVRAVDSGDGLRVVGLKPGVSTLVIDRRSYLVRVSLSAQKDFAREFRARIGRMKGLRIESDGPMLELHGTLLRFRDWQELATLARGYQGEYRFRAQALPDVADQALRFLKKTAADKGFPVVRFTASPRFAVHLPKAAHELREEVDRVFGPYGIEVEIAPSDLALAPLVRTKVVLAEVSKSFSRDLGVKWPSEYNAQLLPAMRGDEGLMAKLQALEAEGQAQILAAPTLLCRSGGQAEFHAGGEFPIRVVARHSRDVIWKSHGVLLKVRPKADFQGAMSVAVETEISILDMANAVEGVPALKTNRVRSHFDLAGKRTIALSGLLRQEFGDSREGLPFLSSIPVLGSLFSSRKFLNHQTELVVFVTPEIHSPELDEQIEMPEGWVKHGM